MPPDSVTVRPLSAQAIAGFKLVFSWSIPLPVHHNMTCPPLELAWSRGWLTTTVRLGREIVAADSPCTKVRWFPSKDFNSSPQLFDEFVTHS